MNPTVRLAEAIVSGMVHRDLELQDRHEAFVASRQPRDELFDEARRIRSVFAVGTPMLGLFLGLVAAARLIGVSSRQTREGYETDRALCFSCGRCFAYCPREQTRRKKKVEE